MAATREFNELVLNVLGYLEDDEWVALALDIDLRGYGESFEEALDDLMELVEMQVSFAMQKGLPQMIWRPSEGLWHTRWAEARRQRFDDLVARREGSSGEYRAGAVAVIPPAFMVADSAEFSRVDA